ncbi:MAG: aminotransferase [Planctomycetota bacterium]|nr:MAG: aminotransferase [Planctomycetota bacterium]
MSAPASDPTDLKLFIPGPSHVRKRILEAQAKPMIGHRSPFMKELLADVLPGVREAFGTKGDVVVLSCSSTAAMEGVSRSVVRPGKKALHLPNGNFSTLWRKLSSACGLDVAVEEKPWGEGWDEASVSAALDTHGEVDAVFVAHCETSTGALSDIAGVARAVRARCPQALVCVDVTSSAAGAKIDFDAIDIDIAVGGVQKAWALPAALALAAVSPRAKARMTEVPNRGYTNDLLSALAYQDEKGMTSTTPAIPVMQALRVQLGDIAASGGFAARFDKHLEMQKLVLDWAAGHGFSVLAHEGFRSPTVTSIGCDGRFTMSELVSGYRDAGYFITGGYGKTKETHWRIGHMGDHTPDDVTELLRLTDDILKRIGLQAPAKA